MLLRKFMLSQGKMLKAWLLFSLTIFVIVVASVSFIEYQSLSENNQNSLLPWMLMGAYATYEGHIDAVPCNLSLVIQVTDLNATHALICTNSTITTSFLPTVTDRAMLWVNRTNISFQPNGETLLKTYPAQIPVKNVGIRNGTVYEYSNEAINATYYIDNTIVWPVKITYTTPFDNQLYTLEFNLKDTNIEGLNALKCP